MSNGSKNVVIPKRAQDLHEKGQQALDNGNYDYAIALFEGALDIAPAFFECRKKLRLAKFRKFDLEKPGVTSIYLKLLFNIKPYLHARYHVLRGEWISAIKEFEKVLSIHPKHKGVLLRLALAAEKNGMIDVAVDSLNAIRCIDPKDVTVIKQMARIYKEAGQLDNARRCYEDVLSINQHDPDAGPELRKIAAIGTIQQTAWDRMETFRDKIKDEEQAKLFEKETKLTRTESEVKDLISSLEKKLALAPQNLSIMKNLSDLYFQLHDYDRAAAHLKSCIEVNPADPTLKRGLALIELKSIERDINRAKEKLFDRPDDEALKTLVRELEHRKSTLRLADCIARVEQYPTNLLLRYELGCLYMESNMVDQAITEFQLSVKTPSKRVQSLNCLGSCFKQKKMFDLAIEQFTAALENMREMTPAKKELVYNLASTYEAMGHIEKAVAEFKKIYTVDIAYRDVAVKIEKTYRGF
jgi:tetratricopeptide (TPR) repeat protein